jgi:hypothetical protein
MYMAGKDMQFTKNLGVVDADVTEKIAKYFGGEMMEARRIMEPPAPAAQGDPDPEPTSSDSEDA